jgi:hypothetical protein
MPIISGFQGIVIRMFYCHVDDIKKALQSLLNAGAQPHQAVKDVGGGTLIASVRDADGNVIGLRKLPCGAEAPWTRPPPSLTIRVPAATTRA